MPRVLITPSVLQNLEGPHRETLRSAGFEAVFPAPGAQLMQPAGLLAGLKGIDAVIAGMEPFNEAVLSDSKLRVIARMGVGYDAIDVPAASRLGVAIVITAGANDEAVAEHTVALMLAVFRAIPARELAVRQGSWPREVLPRLAGRTLGLVGMGRIGRSVVPRAIGLGMTVIAFDPAHDVQRSAPQNVRIVSLDELLAQADVISLHAPATDATFEMINAESISKMKPGAVLVNTARGSLVDEAALAEALAGGHLGGAALDVFKIEPLPPDSPLLRLDNVVLSPHMAGLDKQSQTDMSRVAAECIVKLYRGEWPEACMVNPEIRDSWKW